MTLILILLYLVDKPDFAHVWAFFPVWAWVLICLLTA